MSQSRDAVLTDHGLLVVWGQFAHRIGLIPAIQALSFAQKTVDHSPQRKVLEFLVAILGGLEYLKDISLSARPLDKDQAVAQACPTHSRTSKNRSRLAPTAQPGLSG